MFRQAQTLQTTRNFLFYVVLVAMLISGAGVGGGGAIGAAGAAGANGAAGAVGVRFIL